MATRPAHDHAALMDRVYRGQRHIYDFTRKYYLFGRDRMVGELDCRPGMALLELGCGTGRNLALIRHRWAGVRCHGLDISSEMLKSARKRLGANGPLALGDATGFDAQALFGRTGFDRVVLSYAVSMIPQWHAAIEAGANALAPGGSLHIVDFGDGEGIPAPLRRLFDAWLARFHVAARRDLPDIAEGVADRLDLRMRVQRGPLGYYRLVRLTRPM